MGSSESKAKCSFCQKEFDIWDMSETALKSHKKSTKHAEPLNEAFSNIGMDQEWTPICSQTAFEKSHFGRFCINK